jgi:ribonuclease HIII
MAISVKLCSGRTGFEVSTNMKIDLIEAGRFFNTRVATKYLLILEYNGVEVSMYPSGRMIIKTESKEESLDIAKKLLSELGFQPGIPKT